ncbi:MULTISPECIES: AfsR/SARP family transcriptional regulator [Catenuloplanes]|uniref:DNA-binding SARP family transcriptional activator n=1 Tax=Catenuloplanes niger TaxID=587534 RepID=A0AAE4A1B0_9ACTN|nr:AfsR/SARP family transcriptional regulator [Catenuloplanes niger]MDR7327405.1 DNA-binding SARP family transcriptional activator [Catenuloplanes niger]
MLGPLTVRHGGRDGVMPGAKARTVLGHLVVHAGQLVTTDALIAEVWADAPPATAANTLQTYVSQLRRLLEPGRAAGERPRVLRTVPGGYLLDLPPDQPDSRRFEEAVRRARAAVEEREYDKAADLLHAALGWWRGPAYGTVPGETAAREAARLAECRLAATELRIDADLALGRHAEIVGELERFVAEQPWRERPVAQLMLALYRCHRQADALAVHRAARLRLVDELGVEPGPELRALEQRILRQDPDLLPDGGTPAPAPATPRAAPSHAAVPQVASPQVVPPQVAPPQSAPPQAAPPPIGPPEPRMIATATPRAATVSRATPEPLRTPDTGTPDTGTPGARTPAVGRRRAWWRGIAAGVALLLAAGAGTAVLASRRTADAAGGVFHEFDLAVRPGLGYDLDIPDGRPSDWHATNNPRSPDYDFLDLYRTSPESAHDQLSGVDLTNTNAFNAIHAVNRTDPPGTCRGLPRDGGGNVRLAALAAGARICLRTHDRRWAMLTVTRMPETREAVLALRVTVLND